MAHDEHEVNPGGIQFFEQRMNGHSAVASVARVERQLYRIGRTRGDSLLVFLSGMYVLGLFDYYELTQRHEGLNSIVMSGPWLKFTPDAKAKATSDRVGLFKIAGFMGSLSRYEHWNYDGPAADE